MVRFGVLIVAHPLQTNDVSTYINTFVHINGLTIIPSVIQGHHRFFSNFLILELQNKQSLKCINT